MNNNLDTFIKYSDGELSTSDRKNLEEQLAHNIELKAEFDFFSQMYSSNKNNIYLDDRYFATLLPNAKKKIFESKPIWESKYVLVLPILIVGLIILLVLPATNSKNENFNSLIEIASLDDEIANNIIITNPNYFTDDQILNEFYNEDIILDASVFDYLEENLSNTEINSDLVDSFTESEFNSMYEQIYEKNIIGIK